MDTAGLHLPRVNSIPTPGGYHRYRSCGTWSFHLALWATLTMLAATNLISPVYGQVLPRVDPTGRSGERRPELLEEKPPTPPPELTIPSPPMTERESAGSLYKSVFVRKIVVTGSTVFTEGEIARATIPYENRNVTSEDLETLRRELTLLYVKKGYVNSGAVIPDQTVADGVIALRIIEGKLTHIEVTGNKWFRETFLINRIALGAKTPVNITPLQDRLQILQQDQRIKSIHAELTPGTRPGESELKVNVEEKPPFSLWMGFNNYQSPSVGAERGLATLAHQNLTGRADILSLTYGHSKGLDPELDAWYVAPVSVYDTTLLLRYRKNDYDVVEKPFKSLEISSKSDIFEITLRQPLYRTLNQEFAVAITGEREKNRTYMSGEPFPFNPDSVDGKSVVVPLRFSQEWTYRTQKQVIVARSRFTWGLDTWDATIQDKQNAPDGKFFAWLGQFQWARILDFRDIQLLFRADMQLSDNPLLSLEQMPVGGRYSVRGYRENLLIRDQAIIASLEFRIPLIQNRTWADYIQLCPFYDYGRGTNRELPTPDPRDISSVGVGLRWSAPLIKSSLLEVKAEAEGYWGYAMRQVDALDNDLQDKGIHFQIAVSAFF